VCFAVRNSNHFGLISAVFEDSAILCENREELDDRINNLKLLRPIMPATIVVGGQYGSEGKGKVVALLASRSNSPWLVRCGGPNSGHTVTINGKDGKKLRIAMDEWDFVKDPELYKRLASLVDGELNSQ
jgi:hypothetical protein